MHIASLSFLLTKQAAMLKRSLVVLGALVAIGSPSAAQVVPTIGDHQPDAALTIKLGDGAISGKRITPNAMAWSGVTYFDKAAPVKGGIWNVEVRGLELDGRKVLVRTAGAVVMGHVSLKILGYNAFVNVVDADTLAPIWSEHHNFDGSWEKWIVKGVHVEHHTIGAEPNAKEVVERFDTPVPAYDFDGPVLPFYYTGMQLKVGYSGVIPAIGTPDHPLRGVPFKVVRSEKIQAGARGLVDAYLVEMPDPTAGTLQFWFSDQFSFPLRMIIPEAPGRPKAVYDMIG
jgi:hypothetical protein